MRIEVSDNVTSIGTVYRMLAEYLEHGITKCAFASAAFTLEHQSDFGALVRMLYGPCQPVDDIVSRIVVATGEYPIDMCLHQRPVASLGGNTPTPPQVELAVDDFDGVAWCES